MTNPILGADELAAMRRRAEAATPWPWFIADAPTTLALLDMLAQRDARIKELREALYRLKTECELDGLANRAGFDCWVANAARVLASQDQDGEAGR